ncbi:GlxA family transcriptional regulator [Oceanobacter mangrovi]|uniref:GlxA family transcriptional regulator n=1 Tax=Oceanobacter mangrovi TaxID=2862510 RepID=UPI001C8D673F|nr:helix-turn-helix domain-containing protein [Oceanobacter mangrovi]
MNISSAASPAVSPATNFKSPYRNANHAYVRNGGPTAEPGNHRKVAVVLLEHFSMSAFSVAVDVLITTNLVNPVKHYEVQTWGVERPEVMSDLAFSLPTQGVLADLQLDQDTLLVICGGYRNRLEHHPLLSQKLQQAAMVGATLCGIWNGAYYLAEAGVMSDIEIAIHQDNHALMSERFPTQPLASKTWQVGHQRLSCAGPNSVLDMMLAWVASQHGQRCADAVEEVIGKDRGRTPSSSGNPLLDGLRVPEILKESIRLMQNNIDEPLGIDELAELVGTSRRQLERLFNNHTSASPARYYMELRLNHARQLLQQTNLPITEVSVASGFVSSSHFSRSFRRFFGIRPIDARVLPSR